MTILAADELQLREPRLLMPGMAPVGPVKANRQNEICNKLATLIVPATGSVELNLINNRKHTRTNSALYATDRGLAAKHAISQSAFTFYHHPFGLDFGTLDASYFVLGQFTASGSERSFAVYIATAGVIILMSINSYIDSAGSVFLQSGTVGVGMGWNPTANITSALDGKYHLIGCSRTGGKHRLFWDGVEVSSADNTVSITGINITGSSYFGGTSGSRGMQGPALLAGFTMAGQALTPAEWLSLASDPFQLIEPA